MSPVRVAFVVSVNFPFPSLWNMRLGGALFAGMFGPRSRGP